MITEEELKYLNDLLVRHKPSDLFTLPSLRPYVSNSKVKLGTRKLFVDVPRGTYEIISYIIGFCDNEIRGSNFKEDVDRIKAWKKDTETDIGFLTESLGRIGIRWNIDWKNFYKKPVITINLNRYYRKFWIDKVGKFINDLNHGDDSPIKIYNKVRTLTPSYEKVQLREHEVPLIFELFFGKNFSLFMEELTKLWESISKFKDVLEKLRLDIRTIIELEQIFMDLKVLIQQILMGIKRGYCLNGFILLRKILTDIGRIVFLLSYSTAKGVVFGRELGDDWKGVLNYWSFSFMDDWVLIAEYGNTWIVERIGGKVERKSKKIVDLNTFKNIIRKEIPDSIEPKDRFLVEQLDVIRSLGVDIFKFAKENLQLTDKKIYEEYRKLSEIVHEPAYLDYPPFSSFLEYLGFLHHLRKTRLCLQEVMKNYRRFLKSSFPH